MRNLPHASLHRVNMGIKNKMNKAEFRIPIDYQFASRDWKARISFLNNHPEIDYAYTEGLGGARFDGTVLSRFFFIFYDS